MKFWRDQDGDLVNLEWFTTIQVSKEGDLYGVRMWVEKGYRSLGMFETRAAAEACLDEVESYLRR